jgi:DNA repair exonuclease SbcCD nuclease subunit
VKLLIVSDPHLGLTRSANFTAESSAAREAESRKVLGRILDTPHDEAICGGDFFDKFSNSEQLLLESLHYAEAFDFILAGNHDLSNRQSAKSSLEVVDRVLQNGVFEALVSDSEAVSMRFVPHCLTQDLFEHQLDQLCPEAGKRNLLFLHCNYDISFEQDYASLNLSASRAAQLLKKFDHIFIGHVHAPSDHFDDRLHIVGSHFPTAFDNLTDKRHMVYDSDTNTVKSIWHWKAQEHVYTGPADQAPDGKQFYDFTSVCDPKLVNKLFKQGAFGVRVPCKASQRQALKIEAFERLPDAIARELREKDRDLFELWTEMSNADLD